jgi:hypothetical protein
MKKSKLLRIILCILVFFTGVFAEISDEKNLLNSIFLQDWNKTLSETQFDYSVKVSVFIFGAEKHESDTTDSLQVPEITIFYNDTTGFEIYQSNFSGDNNFVIPLSVFNQIIPEANVLFKSGKTNEATEYVLLNVVEMIRSQKLTDEFEDDIEETTQNFNKIPYLFTIVVLLVVFLFVILKKKKKPKKLNSSYFFNGMSKSGFFGGDLDSI